MTLSRRLFLGALGTLPLTRLAHGQAAHRITILHMNDFHGQVLARRFDDDPTRPPKTLGGYPTLVRYVGQQRERYGKDNVWVTDAGDWYQGTPEGNEDKGASIIECLNRLDLVASQIGNHEFDFGEDNVAALVKLAKHPILGANILDKSKSEPTPRPYAKPWIVLTKNGVKIAIVGLVTKDTKSVATGPFGDAEFADEDSTLQRVLPQLRSEQKPDAVVLLTHCGLETDRKLAQRFPEIVLVLGGHSHTAIRRPVRDGSAWIVQSGSKGGAMTRVHLATKSESPRLEVLGSWYDELDTDKVGVDSTAAEFVKERFGKISAPWDEVIGNLDGDLGKSRGRTPNSTAAGNLIAALIRTTAEADIGLTNKGGVRTGIQLGPITRRQVYELVPFENSIAAFALTGTQVFDLLQQALEGGRQPLEIDGAIYRYEIVDGARKLVEVEVGGKPIDRAKKYRVATNSFLAGGGEGLTIFAKAERLPTTVAMQRFLRDLLIDELVAKKTLQVTGEPRIQVFRR